MNWRAGLRLKQLIGFAYHLMLVNQLLAGRRLQEIEAAILAAAALAAHHGDDVARVADAEGIAGELLYPPDEIFYDYSLEAWIETLVVTLIETLVVTLIETLVVTLIEPLVATLIETLVADRKCHGIGINHYLATIEKIAVNPIHYHPVALFQMRRETPGGHREDSECIGSHRPYQEQRQA